MQILEKRVLGKIRVPDRIWTHGPPLSSRIYIITQVVLAFWLVLAYDLLEDRRTIDVIVSKFFPLCFKMAESFENLDPILRDWVRDKVKKLLSRHWTGTRSIKKKDKAVYFLENDSEKYSCSFSRHSSETKPSTKLVSVSRERSLYLEFNKPNKEDVYEINLFEKFNFFQSRNNC